MTSAPVIGLGVIERLASYMIEARTADLPPTAAQAGKLHVLDTLAAMVSGADLEPGRLATQYVRQLGGVAEATVVRSDIATTMINAAMANAMLAHADETDDSHHASGTHPGCAIVPAALAAAEKYGATGDQFLRAVILGYDVGCRVVRSLGRVPGGEGRDFSEKGVGNTFGAAAAASALAGLSPVQLRHLFAYAAQQASGIRSSVNDEGHVEKSFLYGGMPARNGTTATAMVMAGLTGEWDVFEGDAERNFFRSFSARAVPEELLRDLGVRYEVELTSIKKYSVGSPIQAAADALLAIIAEHGLRADDVERLVVTVRSPRTTNDRPMPDVNMQYILSAVLLDGELTFAIAHDRARMDDPSILDLKRRIVLQGPPEERDLQGIVEVATRSGRHFRHEVRAVRGTPENPMTAEEVERKALELMAPGLGAAGGARVIDLVRNLEALPSVEPLVAALRGEAPGRGD